MAPQILHRVLHMQTGARSSETQSPRLQVKPAILHGYQRRRVKGADYPGIIPASSTTTTTTSSSSSSSVLGTLVTSLTASDIRQLDYFEGSEYIKERVTVRILQESPSVGGRLEGSVAKPADGRLRDVLDAARAEVADEGEEVRALTYVFVGGEGRLEEGEWDFETFKKERLAWWVGADESEL